MDEETILRFCNKIRKDNDTGCWNWIGATSPRGYGSFKLYGKVYAAHRVAMHLFNNNPLLSGSRTEGLVLHKCNNSLCVNPRHLYVGTQKDNIKDSVNSGSRFIRKSQYTTSDRNNMMDLRNRGFTDTDIARQFGCGKANIGDILRGDVKLADEVVEDKNYSGPGEEDGPWANGWENRSGGN